MKFSPRAIGLIAALVTILIWTSFIVIARASASHSLLPLDIAFLRILGAGSVLLPWAWWLMRPQSLTQGFSLRQLRMLLFCYLAACRCGQL